MNGIKASCPCCGGVELTSADLALVVYANRRDWSYYLFDCPKCGDQVRKPADGQIVTLLANAGVHQVRVHVPNSTDRPPLTEDDLISFGLALAETDNVIGLVQS